MLPLLAGYCWSHRGGTRTGRVLAALAFARPATSRCCAGPVVRRGRFCSSRESQLMRRSPGRGRGPAARPPMVLRSGKRYCPLQRWSGGGRGDRGRPARDRGVRGRARAMESKEARVWRVGSAAGFPRLRPVIRWSGGFRESSRSADGCWLSTPSAGPDRQAGRLEQVVEQPREDGSYNPRPVGQVEANGLTPTHWRTRVQVLRGTSSTGRIESRQIGRRTPPPMMTRHAAAARWCAGSGPHGLGSSERGQQDPRQQRWVLAGTQWNSSGSRSSAPRAAPPRRNPPGRRAGHEPAVRSPASRPRCTRCQRS